MNCGPVDTRIDGRGIDVDTVELIEDIRLVPDRDPADLDAVLARIGQRSLVPEQ